LWIFWISNGLDEKARLQRQRRRALGILHNRRNVWGDEEVSNAWSSLKAGSLLKDKERVFGERVNTVISGGRPRREEVE
jgi:hypothetical protein